MDDKKSTAPDEGNRERQKVNQANCISEREALIREYERRLAKLKSGASPSDVVF